MNSNNREMIACNGLDCHWHVMMSQTHEGRHRRIRPYLVGSKAGIHISRMQG